MMNNCNVETKCFRIIYNQTSLVKLFILQFLMYNWSTQHQNKPCRAKAEMAIYSHIFCWLLLLEPITISLFSSNSCSRYICISISSSSSSWNKTRTEAKIHIESWVQHCWILALSLYISAEYFILIKYFLGLLKVLVISTMYYYGYGTVMPQLSLSLILILIPHTEQ